MTNREKLSFLWNVHRKMDKKTRFAWSQLESGSVFVDVGANLGIVSGAARARGCEVHAVEPNPWAFDVLRHAVPEGPNTHLYNFAASTSHGTVELFLHELHETNPQHFSSGSSLLSSKPNVTQNKVEVEGRDFAAFLKGLGRVDFLKIDIEGYEIELIPYLVEAADWGQVGFVAVETHNKSKWSGISAATIAMKESVVSAGLSEKFSWNWP